MDMKGLESFLERLKEHKGSPKLLEFAGSISTINKAVEQLALGLPLADAELKKVKEAFTDLGPVLKELEGPFKQFDSALKRSIKTFTGVTDASDTLIGSFVNMAKGQKDLGGVVDKVKESFDKAVSGQKIGISIARKFTEGTILLAKANDSAAASFNKATGAGGRFNSQIFELEKQNRKFGIGAADSAAALGDLLQGLSGFGLMARDTQMALADEVAQLERLGASGGDVTGVFQTATKAFGLNTDAAKKLTTQAEQLGQELGITTAQAISDLNSTMPHLANLTGNQVAPAFKRLSEQAVETGLSIDTLTGIADRFMTFETASTAAGNLNAVLGTQMFDTMGLLEAQLEGPQAFIDKLRADLQASVGDFDSLNVYQKQSIANASGMSTLELSKLMNAKALTAEEKKQAESRKKNLKATMDLMAELKALGAELTVAFAPVIKGLKSVLSGMAKMMELFREAGEKIPLIGKGLGGGIGTLVGAGVAAKGGSLLAKGASKLLGWGGKRGADRNNPMWVKDVNDEGESAKKGVMNGILKRLKETKVGKKYQAGNGLLGMGKGFSKRGFGAGALGGLLGGKLQAAGYEKTGGALSGAGKGAMFGSMLGPGGALIGGALGGLGGALGFFNEGSDSTPKGPIVVGDDPGNPRAKPELLVPPPGSAVINNSTMTKLAKQGGGAGGSNAAVVAAVQALGVKMDSMTAALKGSGDLILKVDKREFARLTNGHFGEAGSFPVRGV